VRRFRLRDWPLFGLSLAGLVIGVSGGVSGSAAAAGTALPTGGVVQAGSASIGASSGSTLTINQSSSRAIIDWVNFSIGSGGTVQFNNGSGATLNRVTGASQSEIDGLLSGTGSVYLINSNGVIIGKTGVVDVGGTFAASTQNVTNSNFMSGGDLTFSGASAAAVINYGKIGALGGDVALIAAKVENDGEIDAAKGDVGLAAGYQVVLRDAALDDGKFEVVLGGSGASATNSGLIQAAEVELRANGGNVYALAGNTQSIIKATGVSTNDGKVFLVAEGGTLDVAGTIDARAAGGGGGQIETSGSTVVIGTASIDAGSGGTWLIDPYDLTINSAAASTIETSLASNNVTLQTSATSASSVGGVVNANGAGDIAIISPIIWTSGHTLTLDAYHSVAIDADIEVNGGGGLAINTNQGGAGGELSFGSGDSVTYSSGGSLQINNTTYTLESSANALIAAMVGDPSGNFALAYTSTSPSSADTTPTAATATPVGSFSGKLEGLGSTITGLNINQTTAGSNIGLIGSLSGTVSDLILSNVSVVDSYTGAAVYYIGALAGYSTGTINNVTVVSGTVTGSTTSTTVGGIVGQVDGGSPYGVFNSSFSGTVTGNNYVGGVVGNAEGTVSGDSSSGSVVTVQPGAGGNPIFIGGLVGISDYQITDSYSTSNVTAGTSSTGVGGLVGQVSGGTVTDSYATGSVTASGGNGVGGFVGINYGSISNAYASPGLVSATNPVVSAGTTTNPVGGFVGDNESGATIQYAYTTESVSLTVADTKSGGFAGLNGGSIANAVYDTGSTGLPAMGTGSVGAPGLVGESGSQMSDASAYATNFAGWDFSSVWSPPVTGTDYPELYGVSGVIKVTASGATMVYGDAPPTTGVSVTAYGLQGGDVAAAFTGLTFTSSATSSSPVLGTYTVTPTSTSVEGASGLSYRIVTDSSGPLTITPRPITVSLCTFVAGTCEVEKTYDGTKSAFIPTTDFKLAGVVNSDAVNVASNTATYASANVVDNTKASPGQVTASGFVLGGAAASNYTLTTTGSISANIGVIDPAELTATLTGTIEKTYDTTATATLSSSNYKLNGLVASDVGDVSLILGVEPAQAVNGAGVYGQPGANTEIVNAGKNLLVTFTGVFLSGSAASNYALAGADPVNGATISGLVGQIDPVSITASLSGTVDKVYDGTNTATTSVLYNGTTYAAIPSSAVSLSGAYASDLPNLIVATTSGSYTDGPDVGNHLPVSYGGLSLTGSAAQNYTLTTTTLSGLTNGEIDPRPLTITLTGTVSKPYDGTDTATLTSANYILSGAISGDTVTLNDPTSGTYLSPNAGSSIPVTVNGLALSSNPHGDYTIASYGGTVTGDIGLITAESLTLTLVGPIVKNYDGTTSATLEASNYDLVGAPVGLTPAELTINYPTGPSSGTYATATAGKNIVVTVTGITTTGTEASDFNISSTISDPVGEIDPLVITAGLTGTIEKTYDGTTTATLGGANYDFTGTIIGGETLGLVAITGNYAQKDVSYVGNVVQNNIPVTFTGLKLTGPYAVDYVLSSTSVTGAVGEIDPKQITAALIGVVDKTYDGTTVATLAPNNYNLIGTIAGDKVSVSTTAGTYASPNVGKGNVGKGIVVTVNGLTLAGANAGDYDFVPTPYSISGPVGEIDPKTITASLNGTIVKTYDGTRTAALGTDYLLNGLVAVDTGHIGLTATAGTYDTKNAGTGKVVDFTGLSLTGANANDYKLSTTALVGANGAINPLAVTLSLTGVVDKTYDGKTTATLASGEYTINGEIAGDNLTVATSTGNYSTKNVGNGLPVTFTGVRLTGANATNYTLGSSVLSGLKGEIDPKTLTVSLVGAVVKTYNGTTAATLAPANYLVVGFVPGDTVALNDPTTGTYASSLIGSGIKVTVNGLALTGLSAGDYKLTTSTLAANIGTIKAK
jgi:filamentous hemagglutinin family protein